MKNDRSRDFEQPDQKMYSIYLKSDISESSRHTVITLDFTRHRKPSKSMSIVNTGKQMTTVETTAKMTTKLSSAKNYANSDFQTLELAVPV